MTTTAGTLSAADLEEMVQVRRDLHAHPETAFEEVRTSALVAERLRALGLGVKTGVGGTGVVATLRGGSPGNKGGALSVHRQRTIGLTLSPIDISVGADMQNDRGTGSHDLGLAARMRKVKLRQIFQNEIFPREDLLERVA